MELLRDSIPMMFLAVPVTALYTRAASSRLPPGLPRFAALLPVIGRIIRGGARDLLLLHPPLHRRLLPRLARHLQARAPRPARPRPPLAPLPLHSTLPRQAHHQTRRDATNNHRPAEPTTKPSSSILSRAIEVAAFACVLHLYQYMDRFHRYIRRLPDTLLDLLPLPVPAPGPAHPLHGGARPRARPGAGAAVRPAVPRDLAARVLGPAVEPDGLGVRVRPRPRAPGRRPPPWRASSSPA
ncbi:hypothetical protein BS78_01G441900 [Paspalum vaginatum]|nr:hypothetical protein BS78_01G441900 [Paspalum vaginatum]